MIFKLGKKSEKFKVLYHAISSYQLLEVILHRIVYHKKDKAILILPDFIVKKYPQYKELERKKWFDEVYLFPYLKILHREEKEIIRDVQYYYNANIPYNIGSFFKIYVAGAHFYFSLFLIYNHISFCFFEDAAGMLSKSNDLYKFLKKKFPIHADIANKYCLYNGYNKYISEIIYLKSAQTVKLEGEKYTNFSVEDELQGLNFISRRKIVKFFLKHRIIARSNIILLTQSFSNLGIMSEKQQKNLFKSLKDKEFKDIKIIIKKHPDDTLDYIDIFKDSYLIEQIFPSELLPYVFWNKPKFIYTFDSTGCENLKKHFIIKKISREEYVK